MTTPVIYLTLEQAIDIHHKTVEVSGGGAMGHLELGKLESALTHLFFGACKFHSFEDGNKRIAITLCAQMLLLNGYLYCSGNFIREMENISYHVAAGLIDKELLAETITAVLDDELESEYLKLKILNAISTDHEEGEPN